MPLVILYRLLLPMNISRDDYIEFRDLRQHMCMRKSTTYSPIIVHYQEKLTRIEMKKSNRPNAAKLDELLVHMEETNRHLSKIDIHLINITPNWVS